MGAKYLYKTGLNDTTMEVEIGGSKTSGGSVPGGGCGVLAGGEVGLGALAFALVPMLMIGKRRGA